MKKPLFASLCVIALFLSSCVPKTHTTAPAVEGHIIDKNTKEPMEGIILSKNIQTDKKGHFSLPAKTELGINTPMGGHWNISRSFVVRKKGFTSLQCTCEVFNSSTGCENVVIPMSKEASTLHQNNIIKSNMLHCIPLLTKMKLPIE